ncbi:MAG: 4a-hydroxytetrahydrobiopterin dehydratase [Paracoccaceae bacterium]
MSRPLRLEGEARASALAELIALGWGHDPARDAITQTLRFADFNQAFGWMTRVAMIAEQLDHHPEWSNTYRTVTVTLTTHDAKGLTDLDLAMARRISGLG